MQKLNGKHQQCKTAIKAAETIKRACTRNSKPFARHIQESRRLQKNIINALKNNPTKKKQTSCNDVCMLARSVLLAEQHQKGTIHMNNDPKPHQIT